MAENYYVLGRDDKYYQVDGIPVSIEGFEGLDLFAHPALDNDQIINISEGSTGCRIASGKDTDEGSIAALEALIFHGPDEILKRTVTLIKEHGLSPRFACAGAPAVAAAPHTPSENTSSAEIMGDSQREASNKIMGPSSDLPGCG